MTPEDPVFTLQGFLNELRQEGRPWEILPYASGAKGAALERQKLRYIAAGAVPSDPETILRFLKQLLPRDSKRHRWVRECYEHYSKPAAERAAAEQAALGITHAMVATEILRRRAARKETVS